MNALEALNHLTLDILCIVFGYCDGIFLESLTIFAKNEDVTYAAHHVLRKRGLVDVPITYHKHVFPPGFLLGRNAIIVGECALYLYLKVIRQDPKWDVENVHIIFHNDEERHRNFDSDDLIFSHLVPILSDSKTCLQITYHHTEDQMEKSEAMREMVDCIAIDITQVAFSDDGFVFGPEFTKEKATGKAPAGLNKNLQKDFFDKLVEILRGAPKEHETMEKYKERGYTVEYTDGPVRECTRSMMWTMD